VAGSLVGATVPEQPEPERGVEAGERGADPELEVEATARVEAGPALVQRSGAHEPDPVVHGQVGRPERVQPVGIRSQAGLGQGHQLVEATERHHGRPPEGVDGGPLVEVDGRTGQRREAGLGRLRLAREAERMGEEGLDEQALVAGQGARSGRRQALEEGIGLLEAGPHLGDAPLVPALDPGRPQARHPQAGSSDAGPTACSWSARARPRAKSPVIEFTLHSAHSSSMRRSSRPPAPSERVARS
jgi:hypothetical protein